MFRKQILSVALVASISCSHLSPALALSSASGAVTPAAPVLSGSVASGSGSPAVDEALPDGSVESLVESMSVPQSGEVTPEEQLLLDSAPAAPAASASSAPKKASAKTLDDFKAQQQELLFENMPFSEDEASVLFEKDEKLETLENLIKRLSDAREQVEGKREMVTSHRITLEEYIGTLDKEISETQGRIDEIRKKIALTNRAMGQYGAKIDETNTKIGSNRDSMLEYLSHIYTKSELVYGQDQTVDMVKTLILNDGDVSQIFSDMYHKTLVEATGQSFVERNRSLVREYEFNKNRLRESKQQDIASRAELLKSQSAVAAQRDYKEKVLELTKGKEQLFNDYIYDKLEAEHKAKNRIAFVQSEYDRVYQEISERYSCDLNSVDASSADVPNLAGNISMEDIAKISEGASADQECVAVKRFFDAEKQLRASAAAAGTGNLAFIWPVTPRKNISAYFHDPDYYDALGSEHDAVDIPTPQGTDIVAPADGYVYYINPPTPGGYSFVAMRHSDDTVTVYGHVSEVSAKLFDFVKQGQVFAKSGGAVGTPGAGVMTSGPHLHFEMYRAQKAVDPLRSLDLSYLDFDSLKDKYRYKFVEDYKKRYQNKGNLAKYQKFYIVGDDEIARQKYLLAKYAAPSFNSLDIWTTEAVGAGIDPSFLMCVGLAESGLGRHLKTPYNVGNVGNTDSGSTYTFPNAQSGVHWMVKTFNNQYLSKYQTLDMLSRYGNKSGSIYASSSKNWHNNIVRCLSSLKGRFVEDDFAFRIKAE
jgi:murein DD-endopeptidase MepM/ murein hydrolase activator NlpD